MRRVLTWTGIAILWIGFLALSWFLSQQSTFAMADFRVYYDGALLLRNGQPLYQGTVGMVYLYPPLLAQLLLPLVSFLSLEQVWVVWFGLNVLLLLGIVILLSRATRRSRWLWVMTPLFLPITEALGNGQVTVILLVLMAGAWLAVKQKRCFLAGALLALAAWLKVYPALLIVYFIWKRDWQVVRGALVGGIALGLLQIAISGPETMIEMSRVLFTLTNSGQDHLIPFNASILGFTSQLFQSHPNVTALVVQPTLYLISRAALTLSIIGGWLYLTARRDRNDFDFDYTLTLLTALLISPTFYPPAMPPLLLVYFLLLHRRYSPAMIAFVTLACVLLSIYWPVMMGYYSTEAPLSGLVMSFAFYTLLATWLVNAFLLYRDRAVQKKFQLVQQVEG